MPWDDPLSRTLVLADGRELKTLREAGTVLTEAFVGVTKSAMLEYAIELLLEAERTGTPSDIKAATDQVERVLIQRVLMR